MALNFLQLRKEYPEFIYQSYDWQWLSLEVLEISFVFQMGKYKFNPSSVLEFNCVDIKNIDNELINSIVFNIGLIESFSYWKCACSPKVVIQAGNMSLEQILFWESLLIKGLGEFYYRNNIDFTVNDFVKIIVNSKKPFGSIYELNTRDNSFLLTFGGGKDSSVSLRFLTDRYKDSYGFTINPSARTLKIIKSSGLAGYIILRREIDPLLFRLNAEGGRDLNLDF